MEKTQTEFIFKGKRHDFKAISKELSGKYISFGDSPTERFEKNVSKRETNEAKEWIQIKKKSFHPSFV